MDDLVAELTRAEDSLAQDIVRRMEEARPHLYERYGESARDRTQEDVRFHIQHLIGALTVGDPGVFATYYNWLLSVLLPRGVVQEDIDLNFACMSEALHAYVPTWSGVIDEYLAPTLEISDHRG